MNDMELISLRIKVEVEMTSRGIEFSVGRIGEQLAIDYFNSTPGLPNLMEAPTGAKNVDALSRDGERYSIKTQLKAKKTGAIYPDSIEPDRQLFEHILVVKLAEDYSLSSLYSFTWKAFKSVRAWDKRMNAWYIPTSAKRLKSGNLLYSLHINDSLTAG